MNRLAVLCLALLAFVAAPAFAQKGFTTPVVGSGEATTTDETTTSGEMSEEDMMTTFQERAAAYVEAHPEKAEALLLNLYLLKVRMMMNAEAYEFLSMLVDYVAGLVKEMNPDSSIVAMVSASAMTDEDTMEETTDEETTEDEAMTEETTDESATEESTDEEMTDEETTTEETTEETTETEEDAMTDTGAVATGTTTVETSGSRKNN